MEYLVAIPFIISFYYLIMMALGKLKSENKIDDANTGGLGSSGNSTLCDSSNFDCSFNGGDGGGS